MTSDPNLGRRTLNQWFNTSAFAQNPVVNGRPVDGNSPRNYLTGPATHTVDLNLARTFAITERAKYQFRAEAPNAFNIVNYGTPRNNGEYCNLRSDSYQCHHHADATNSVRR